MSVYQGNRNAFPSVTHITQESPSGSSFIKSEPNLKSSDIQGGLIPLPMDITSSLLNGSNTVLGNHQSNLLASLPSSSASSSNLLGGNLSPLLDVTTTSFLNGGFRGHSNLLDSLPNMSSPIREHHNSSVHSSPDDMHGIKYDPMSNRCSSKSAEDAEGVWSPDIEMAFQEALHQYPPCGRRKIILTEEGKMYGRNELIARYIKDRTGKRRTRKQVSSHIQVLARKKSKEVQQQIKVRYEDNDVREKILQQMATMSSAQIVDTVLKEKQNLKQEESSPSMQYYKPEIKTECKTPQFKSEPLSLDSYGQLSSAELSNYFNTQPQMGGFPRTISSLLDSNINFSLNPSVQSPVFRSVGTKCQQTGRLPRTSTELGAEDQPPKKLKLKMLQFNGYMEQGTGTAGSDEMLRHYFIDLNTETDFTDPGLEKIDIKQIYDKFPSDKGGLKDLFETGPKSIFFLVKFWVNLNIPEKTPPDLFYGHDNVYESDERIQIKCSTKACSFGGEVVEKVQTEWPVMENNRMLYRMKKSPLCNYMINFIHKLRGLPAKTLMNNVLENFTVLQVITNAITDEMLLCVACVFEVADSGQPQHHVYQLVRE